MEKEHIVIAGIPIEVWRKPIKNIHLAVYAPDGRVRISVPRFTSPEVLQRSLSKRMGWIRRQRQTFLDRPLPASLLAESGERHAFFGEKYPLRVREGSKRNTVTFDKTTGICLMVRRGSSSKSRLALLDAWYRQELRHRIEQLLPPWQRRIGEEAREFRIKKMKTRWGTCNINARRLWINLELVKKPEVCLELIVVHELLHLLERNHNARFYGYLDSLLPGWRITDALL
jgi:predicted metal-dependent hydrolase